MCHVLVCNCSIRMSMRACVQACEQAQEHVLNSSGIFLILKAYTAVTASSANRKDMIAAG